jgi:hypothetical protein
MTGVSASSSNVAGRRRQTRLSDRATNALALQSAEDEAVASADPLACDKFFAEEFVSLNRDHATSLLALRAGNSAREALAIFEPTRVVALAILRDLGMMAAALVHDGGPSAELAQVRRALARMGRIADEVPRDTVFSYGPRNPRGTRERHFTGTSDERAFIGSFREGITATASSIVALRKACEMSLDDEDFPATVDAAAERLRQVVEIMVRVRREIRAEVFTGEIRPFFEIIEIAGREFVAPGGAQIPLLAIDMMTWADRIPQLQLYRYLRENVDYYPRLYRDLIEDIEGRPSLLQRLNAYSKGKSAGRPAQAVYRLMAELVRFRFPHRKVTQENMRLRAYGSYQTQVLDQLLENTVAAQVRIKSLVEKML